MISGSQGRNSGIQAVSSQRRKDADTAVATAAAATATTTITTRAISG